MYSSSGIAIHVFAEVPAFGIDAQRIQVMVAQLTEVRQGIGYPYLADTGNMSQTQIDRQVNNLARQPTHGLITIEVDGPAIGIGRR
jgi:hypothetical protein